MNECCFGAISVSGGIRFGGSATVSIPDDPTDGFVFFLPLNEEEGPFVDLSRNGLDGGGAGTAFDPEDTSLNPTLGNGAWCGGVSQTFDGRQSIILPPDVAANEFSFSVWIKLRTNYRTSTIWSRSGFVFGVDVLNRLTVETAGGHLTATTRLNKDSWYHVAVTWSGTVAKVFVNGVLDGTKTLTGDIEESEEFFLGRSGEGTQPIASLVEARMYGEVMPSAWWLSEFENVCGSLVGVGAEVES